MKKTKNYKIILEKTIKPIRENLLEIEKRDDLTEEDKVNRIIKIISVTCAGIATQPIPFADIYVLTPIQAFMGTRIAAIRGVPVKESKSKELVLEISSVVGLGLLAQHIVIGAYKTVIPYLGAITTIPFVFGLTYAMGKVMDQYFLLKSKGKSIDKKEMQAIWKESLEIGKSLGEEYKEGILQKAKASDVSDYLTLEIDCPNCGYNCNMSAEKFSDKPTLKLKCPKCNSHFSFSTKEDV